MTIGGLRRVAAVALLPLVLAAAAPPAAVTDAVSRVKASGCRNVPGIGVGIVVADELVVTAAHTVSGASVVLVDGADAQVVALDTRTDIAVLHVPGRDRVDAIRRADTGRAGAARIAVLRDDRVEIIDAPVTRTATIRFRDAAAGTVVERRGLVLTGAVIGGDSGAPVLGDGGLLLGMVFAGSRGDAVSYAVDVSEVTGVLDRLGDVRRPVDTGSC
ncbi:MAG: trypsin-like peptidase domain-containing protein [Acidimicrobiia bacterium]